MYHQPNWESRNQVPKDEPNHPERGESSPRSRRLYSPKRERGGCLTLWLVLATGVSGISFLVSVPQLLAVIMDSSKISPQASTIALVLSALVILIQLPYLISLWGIWQWKRWGFYGVIAFIILKAILQLLGGMENLPNFFVSMFELIIVGYLAVNKWWDFD